MDLKEWDEKKYNTVRRYSRAMRAMIDGRHQFSQLRCLFLVFFSSRGYAKREFFQTFSFDVRILILNLNKRHLVYFVTMHSVFRSRGKCIFAPFVMPEILFRLTACACTLPLVRLYSIATRNVLLPTVGILFDLFIRFSWQIRTEIKLRQRKKISKPPFLYHIRHWFLCRRTVILYISYLRIIIIQNLTWTVYRWNFPYIFLVVITNFDFVYR